MVIAIDVTTTGEKRLLGLVQTATEDARVIAAFLRDCGIPSLGPESERPGEVSPAGPLVQTLLV